MMIDSPAARRATETRALMVALAIAAKADWRPKPVGPTLSTPYAGYLSVDASRLVIAPTSAGLPFAVRLVSGAMREGRSDALIVSCLTDPMARPTILFALGRWSSSALRWMSPAWPFLAVDGVLWLVPARRETGGRAVPLLPGPLLARPAPWSTIADQDAGQARAIGWIARIVDGQRV